MSEHLNLTSGHNGAQGENIFRVWYTGLNINATAGSRTVVATDLKAGDVLVRDPFNHDGRGESYAQPQTNFLVGPKVYVVEVPPGSQRGGWVYVSRRGLNVPVNTQSNQTAGSTLLGVVNGSFALNTVASLDATVCAVARQTVNTSGAAAIARVDFGAINGS